MNLQLRKANLEDAEILAKIGWQSFDEAFSDHPENHPDDMKIYMDEAFSVETISDDLRDEKTLYLIAEADGEAAGYVKMKFDVRETCVSGEKTLELCRLYALDKFIGKGIGKSLMLEFFKIAEETKRDTVWLGVWEYNYRAQEFYRKFGFEKCGEHVFQLGSDPQTDWVLQKKI
ncbi:MAG: GNAT family N-acetyltransferase [Pyrinomonadaceae bacterium]|nr:GNAT family N-acetyltransferase [Pyrinomonadaceae bacterium]